MPNPNQRVGEYLLQDRIAAGAFGEVWRAQHHVWADQSVAIKIPTDPQYIRNLQHEGSAVHGLHHPNIVRAIGFDPYAETPYLAMEYVPGSSLRPLIVEKRLTPKDAVAIMRQVLAGLAYAHTAGVVHRDIKPENILVHERAFREGFDIEGLIKVTDFGLGKAAVKQTESIAFSAAGDTDAHREIAGTLDYMAPEQRAGGNVDGRADLYAAGVVLFEMLTGEKPAGFDLPSAMNPQSPAYLDDAFKRSYARVDKRFASAEEFSKALTATPPPIKGFAQPPKPPAMKAGPPPIVPPATSKGPPHPPTYIPPATGAKLRHCPQCRGVLEAGDQFCAQCGTQVVENVRRCPQCGGYPDANDAFCMFCGQVLSLEGAGHR